MGAHGPGVTAPRCSRSSLYAASVTAPYRLAPVRNFVAELVAYPDPDHLSLQMTNTIVTTPQGSRFKYYTSLFTPKPEDQSTHPQGLHQLSDRSRGRVIGLYQKQLQIVSRLEEELDAFARDAARPPGEGSPARSPWQIQGCLLRWNLPVMI